MAKVFISWSGKRSGAIAQQLKVWLPDVVQAIEPWVSSEDIYKGTKWLPDVLEKLESYSVGIICLTPENLSSPWIFFEAGALAKSVKGSIVVPLLFGVSKSDVAPPLSILQMTSFDKADCLKMVRDINAALPEGRIDADRLERAFEKNWPDLESRVQAVLLEKLDPDLGKAAPRTNEQILEEVIALARSNDRGLAQIRNLLEQRLSIVEALLSMKPPITFEQFHQFGNVRVSPSPATARTASAGANTEALGSGYRPKGLLSDVLGDASQSTPEKK